jgi:UDP-N-acetylmuramate dehydrogenase
MNKDLFEELKGSLRFDYSLAQFTWLKVGGPAEIFYKPYDLEDLQKFLMVLPNEYDVNVIGAGSNLLIRDGGVKGAVIKLGSSFNYIEEDGVLRVGGSTLNYNLAQFCYQKSIKGFEFLCGIPGTIGGGISMNAGAYGMEFKDIINKVKAVKRDGSLVELTNNDLGFCYRGNSLNESMIFVEAQLKFEYGDQSIIKGLMDDINVKRKATQPINQKTAGSTFANDANHKAWQLIDKVGMRGYTLNGAQISDLHSNFLINLGGASASSLEEIAEMARAKVLSETGVELKWEVKRLGYK